MSRFRELQEKYLKLAGRPARAAAAPGPGPAAVVRGFGASGAENTEVRQSTVVHLTKRGVGGTLGPAPRAALMQPLGEPNREGHFQLPSLI